MLHMQSSNIIMILILVVQIVDASDCLYNSTSTLAICQQYCIKFYSVAPQRAWFNPNTMSCQPMYQCTDPTAYYSSLNNHCFTNSSCKVLSPATIPLSLSVTPSYKLVRDAKMICVSGTVMYSGSSATATSTYGTIGVYAVTANATCLCSFLWIDSGLVDMNGVPFKCDAVQMNSSAYFTGNITYDSNGTVIRYGAFTPTQLIVMQKELQSQAASLSASYVNNVSMSIIYAIETTLPAQPIIIMSELPYLIIFLLISYVVFGLSYWRYRYATVVKVNQEEFKSRLIQIIEDKRAIIIK